MQKSHAYSLLAIFIVTVGLFGLLIFAFTAEPVLGSEWLEAPLPDGYITSIEEATWLFVTVSNDKGSLFTCAYPFKPKTEECWVVGGVDEYEPLGSELVLQVNSPVPSTIDVPCFDETSPYMLIPNSNFMSEVHVIKCPVGIPHVTIYGVDDEGVLWQWPNPNRIYLGMWLPIVVPCLLITILPLVLLVLNSIFSKTDKENETT